MTKYEQEVMINLNAENDMATVYSANPEWIRKMDRLREEFPDIFRLKRWTLISKTYEVPKEYIRIGKPEGLSPAQRTELRKMRYAAQIGVVSGILLWWAALSSLVGSVIIFSITLPTRFPEVRRWKTSVLKK